MRACRRVQLAEHKSCDICLTCASRQSDWQSPKKFHNAQPRFRVVWERDFVTDFVVSHEVEVSGLTASPKAICGECEGEGPVESYCTDCQSYLCKECSNQAHKKLKPYRGHKVIPVQDLDVVSLQSSKVHYCSTHSSKVVKLYCETCRKLVCTKCYLVDHHQHSYVSVQDA